MRKKQRASGQSLLPASAAERKLRAIMPLIEDGEAARAIELLDAMAERYRLPGLYFNTRCLAHSELGTEPARVLLDLLSLTPDREDEAIYLFSRGVAEMDATVEMAGYRDLLRARSLTKDGDKQELIGGLLDDARADATSLADTYGFRFPEDLEAAAKFDRAAFLRRENCHDAAERELRSALEARPDLAFVRDELVRTLWAQCRFDEALQVLGSPDDADATVLLATGLELHAMLGQHDIASAFFTRLTASEPATLREQVGMLRAYAAWRDHGRVLATVRGIRAHPRYGNLDADAAVDFKEAVALAAGGDTAAAAKLLRPLGDIQLARENLDNLELDPHCRRELAYLDFHSLVPRPVASLVVATFDGELFSAFAAIRTEFPQFVRLVPYLIRHGCSHTQAFAVEFGGGMNDPAVDAAVRELAAHENLADHVRDAIIDYFETALEPTSYGVTSAPAEDRKGTVRVERFTITYDPVGELSPEIAEQAETAYRLLGEGRPAEAETILREALRAGGDVPVLLQNLGAACEMQGRREEAYQLLRELHERFPDYLFASAALASHAAGEGLIERARELVGPFLTQDLYHISEFTALCQTMCTIESAALNEQGLEEWISLWSQADPHDQRIERWEAQLDRLRVVLRVKEGMDQLLRGRRRRGVDSTPDDTPRSIRAKRGRRRKPPPDDGRQLSLF